MRLKNLSKRVFRHAKAMRSVPGVQLRVESLEYRVCLAAQNPFAYVSSFGTNSIERYHEGDGLPLPAPGQTGATFVPSGAYGMNHPLAAIVGYDHNFYTTNLETNEVFRFDAKTAVPKPGMGKTGATFISSGLNLPAGLLFGPDGNIYVANAATSVSNVVRYSPRGRFIDVYATLTHTGGASGMVFGPDGKLYVATRFASGVERCDGTTCSDFIPAGTGGLDRAGGVVFGPNGDLFVGSENTNNVLRFNGVTGALKGEFVTSGSGGLSRPSAILFGPEGDLYVCSINTDSILRYNGQTGAFIDVFVSPTNGGALDGPRGFSFWNTNPTTLKYEPGKSHSGDDRFSSDLDAAEVASILSPPSAQKMHHSDPPAGVRSPTVQVVREDPETEAPIATASWRWSSPQTRASAKLVDTLFSLPLDFNAVQAPPTSVF